MKFSRGDVLDNDKLLARVGAGSCGEVWQAENIVSGELEALKILSGSDLAERELRALKLYREINHPSLIRIRHIGQRGNVFFYTMDWCESSLAERRVSPPELLGIAGKLAGGLAELHSRGLLHRDVKPANIFFRQGSPVLGDIGLLTRQEGATFAGSPGFLSPAILSGKATADCYSDCYALAKSIYCALSGEGPEKFPLYTGETTPEASLLMRAVIAVCSDNPVVRSAAELQKFLSSPPPAKRSRLLFLLLTAAVLAAAAAIAIFLFPKKQKTEKISPVSTVSSLPPAPQKTADIQFLRGETEKNFTALPLTALPPDAEEKLLKKLRKELTDSVKSSREAVFKLQKLRRAKEVSDFISDTRDTPISAKDEAFLLSRLTAPQQNSYRECGEKIRIMQNTGKWRKFRKEYAARQFEYQKKIRDLESSGTDAASALQTLTEDDDLLDLKVKQARYYKAQRDLLQGAKKQDKKLPVLLEDYCKRAQEYCKTFYSTQ